MCGSGPEAEILYNCLCGRVHPSYSGSTTNLLYEFYVWACQHLINYILENRPVCPDKLLLFMLLVLLGHGTLVA